jgi:hypothetical protein
MALETSNPAMMQSIIKEFPQTIFVLLHSSYPFSREAGYLAAVYSNVYRAFTVIAAFVSGSFLINYVQLILEKYSQWLADMASYLSFASYSSSRLQVKYYGQVRFAILEQGPLLMRLIVADGHWWPETYYLAAVQVREALYEVRLYHTSSLEAHVVVNRSLRTW